jgi:hypothetical protein
MEDINFFGFDWHVVMPYDPGGVFVKLYFSDGGRVVWLKKGEVKKGSIEYVEYEEGRQRGMAAETTERP